MKPTTIAIVAVTVAALFATVGSAYYLDAREPRKPYPKATPPPDPSPVYTPSNEPVLSEEEIEQRAQDHDARLAASIESALRSRDPQRREAAFVFLLPELLQFEPQRLVDMVQRQEPGEARETLRNELAKQWIPLDPGAAVAWMKSLDENERNETAKLAVDALRPFAPEQAVLVADQLGVDRGKDPLEQIGAQN
jgi:hypothetical protein